VRRHGSTCAETGTAAKIRDAKTTKAKIAAFILTKCIW